MRSLARWTTWATATRKRSKATARATTSKLPTEMMELVVEQDERVVARGVELDLHRAAGVGVGVVAGPVGLGDAPEGERVLQVARGTRTPQVTPGEKLPQPVRGPRLSWVGPHPGRLGVDGREVPPKASSESAAVTSKASRRSATSARTSEPWPIVTPLALMSASPSLAFSRMGSRPAALRASAPGILRPSYSASPRPMRTCPISAISARSAWPTDPPAAPRGGPRRSERRGMPESARPAPRRRPSPCRWPA